MAEPLNRSVFASEAAWPFGLRQAEFTRSLDFLNGSEPGPRVLRVFGESGSGKSFLSRELLVQSSDEKEGIGLYLDVPAGEIEAAAAFDRLDLMLSHPRSGSRDAPSFVGHRACKAWLAANKGTSRGVAYGYRAGRDLTAQIPLAGPFVKAMLPPALRGDSGDAGTAPLRFLLKRSHTHPVLLVVDNVQFLSHAMHALLDLELLEAGAHLRLVLVERIRATDRQRVDWAPPVPHAHVADLELGAVSEDEVAALVRTVLPDIEDADAVSAAVFRRSDGNLKSVWFQLRLIAGRREHQRSLASSYEDVILSLHELDQAVLRFVVFTVGGLRVGSLVAVLRAMNMHAQAAAVTSAVADLVSLGLLVLNGDTADRVRVEHELVAQLVTELTPEDEKLEFRAQVLNALSKVLDDGATPEDEPVLYDRLVGIATAADLTMSPSLATHIVRFVQMQADAERHRYLAGICRDSVCWPVLGALPGPTVRSLLDAIQKCALFEFGLLTVTQLRRTGSRHENLAALYEAKYLVQLFEYEQAREALALVQDAAAKRTVEFNIMLNLMEDDAAAAIAMEVYTETDGRPRTVNELVILRNSIHLFEAEDALDLADAAVEGFQALGSTFGLATALNNRGIVHLARDALPLAHADFEEARQMLEALDSPEIYQALVNLSAATLLGDDVATASELLSAARDAAPRSLRQDAAMLDLNALALALIRGECDASGASERAGRIVAAARRTCDLRFIDVAAWLAANVKAVVEGTQTLDDPSTRRMARFRSNGRVQLEVVRNASLHGVAIEVPFALSPHWRH